MAGTEVWLWLRAQNGTVGAPHAAHPSHDVPVLFAQPPRVGEHVMLAEADGCTRQWLITGIVHHPLGDPLADDFRRGTAHVVAILE